ncbi:MAG: 16S rRNA (guanine(527)-N(7))-methyltransferase RsmG [Alphaproteobacteria bacterium]|nr:16S rRNA (guanine(527)-N(7))-methyltransferase RsmG [Alphaproteobacteria bacterium]MBU1562084.1 16S rRNA (guanine(527)-N(7))-methyltransferase RsmG [Alphaproteobacteria bacterium]MBU2301785.1 16S rRNA (guanine(527)-N(7))-methyltransferase RsmG [Alphaproteobacteria bacterium]MBU2369613.1 16S rRNA (guanine(527)-N(7))-methyltransferase RsmG [Alphaproteobacteria bacterium]
MSNLDALAPYAPHFTRPVVEVAADLESYAQLLRKWQAVQNLVSRETLDDVWSRHFIDSLQVLPLLKPSDHAFLDLGSGGGLPALPLAIALKGPNHHFTLVEPNGRKVSFLRTVARELKLIVTVEGARSDQIDSRETVPPDLITSRALAGLPQLCQWMTPFFAPQTRAILHKGREHVEELAEAATHWDFNVLVKTSDTDASGVLLTLSNLRLKSVR